MTKRFQQVAIVGKYEDRSIADTVENIAAYIAKSGREVVLEQETAEAFEDSSFDAVSREAIGENADLVIVVGGDGTLLNVARFLAPYQTPVLGVNRGRLGFLVDVAPTNFAELDTVLSGNFVPDERMLLQAEIVRNDQPLGPHVALNDVVIHRWNTSRMVELETHVDGRLLNNHRCDGLIVSSPTGSTAYAMSVGGPIIHPQLDAFVMVPICPHTLSNRPIVVGADSTIEIRLNNKMYEHIRVSCDGQTDVPMEEGDVIRIQKAEHKAHLIHPPQHDYYEILRAKLRWGDSSIN